MVRYKIMHAILYSKLTHKLWGKVARFLIRYRVIYFRVYRDEDGFLYGDTCVQGETIGHCHYSID